MLVQVKADFLGSESNSFENKDGEKVSYQKVSIMCSDDNKPLTFSADKDLDFGPLPKYSKAVFDLEITMGNYPRIKVVGYNPADVSGKR